MSWELYKGGKNKYMLENDILRNCSQNMLVVQREGVGEALGVKMTPRHPAG